MNNKIVLESLSMDLIRVSLGLQRGSLKMADRFSQEALIRIQEVNNNEIQTYLKITLIKIEVTLKTSAREKKADDALMYSTIIRNYCQTFL